MPSPPIEISRSLATLVPAESSWDEAFVRVESYVRAHHLEGRVLLNQVVTEIIRDARLRNLGEEPVVAAMNVAQQRIGEWFSQVGYEGDWSDVRVRQKGRLALILGNLPGRWSGYFLSNEPVPPELVSDLAAGVLQPGPELRFSNMPPAPLEFGFDDPSDLNSLKRSRWVVLREAAVWLALVGFFGVAWAASR